MKGYRPSDFAFAVAMMLIGAAAGVGLRTAGDSEVAGPGTTHSPAPGNNPSTRSAVEAGESTLSRRRSARPRVTEEVMISSGQWSQVLELPAQFAFRLGTTRHAHPTDGKLHLISKHAELFGWDETTITAVADAVDEFTRRLVDLEKEHAQVSYPEAGRVVVSFDGMSDGLENLLEDLRHELRGILGWKNARQFEAVADLAGIATERGPKVREDLTFSGDWLTVTRVVSGRQVSQTRWPVKQLSRFAPAVDAGRLFPDGRAPLPSIE